MAGGVIVSIFAILGDFLRPKSFAALFGVAAPSVASGDANACLLEGRFRVCRN
jgi:hypothetical protein